MYVLQRIRGILVQDIIDYALEIPGIKNKLICHPVNVSFLKYLSVQGFSLLLYSPAHCQI